MDMMDVINDWKLYELILFNVVQNAVKYNVQEGDIVIAVKVAKMPQIGFVFSTMVIDSGIGISEERKSMLFIPFLELKTT